MEKVLFLTDFSEVAENAFVYALFVAEKLNAEIHILHVAHIIEAKDVDEQVRVHPIAQLLQEEQQTAEMIEYNSEVKKFKKIAEDNHKLNVQVQFHFEKGYFLEIVDDYIDELDIALVVMGTSGANTVDKKLFGSTTETLINHIKIPLLAVPKDTSFSEVRNFALAVMLNENEYKIVPRLSQELAKISGNRLKLVYVAENEKEALKAEAKKEALLATISKDIPLEIVINSDVIDGLNDFINRNPTDVLCVIHRHKNFMQRVFSINYSNRLLQYSKTALLIYNNKNQ